MELTARWALHSSPAVIVTEADGMITVTGGKWTTYRRMAQEVVDEAAASGRLPLNIRPCATHSLKLLGAQSYRPALHAEVMHQLLASSSACHSMWTCSPVFVLLVVLQPKHAELA